MLLSSHAQLSLAAAGITITASGRTRQGAEYAAFQKPPPGGKGTYACRVVRFKDGQVISERPYMEWGKFGIAYCKAAGAFLAEFQAATGARTITSIL